MNILYEIFCNIWYMVGVVVGLVVLYALLNAVFEQIRGDEE